LHYLILKLGRLGKAVRGEVKSFSEKAEVSNLQSISPALSSAYQEKQKLLPA
jgi:hypothetical protein